MGRGFGKCRCGSFLSVSRRFRGGLAAAFGALGGERRGQEAGGKKGEGRRLASGGGKEGGKVQERGGKAAGRRGESGQARG